MALSSFPPLSQPGCTVRTPKPLYFNPHTNTHVQEYLPGAVSVKSYFLRDPADGQQSQKPGCVDIGHGLGEWLAKFHDWARDPSRVAGGLHAEISQNREMQMLKNSVNYGLLVSNLPHDAPAAHREALEAVRKMSEDELADEAKLQVIHGDFWTGKYAFSPLHACFDLDTGTALRLSADDSPSVLLCGRPLPPGAKLDIFIVDWELCTLGVRPLDLGQMIAEMYELYLFRGIEPGLWLVEGFCAGYKIRDEPDADAFAFRTAIHVGTHLATFGGVADWATEQQRADAVGRGKEIVIRAWTKDKTWFLDSHLACLFRP